jgi:hypothetical protein
VETHSDRDGGMDRPNAALRLNSMSPEVGCHALADHGANVSAHRVLSLEKSLYLCDRLKVTRWT